MSTGPIPIRTRRTVLVVAPKSGRPGKDGEPGPPGPAGSSVIAARAAVALSGHMAVAYDGDGELVPASADNADHVMRVAGITIGAVSEGDYAEVKRNETLDHAGWTWAPDELIYLGLGGALVQEVPPGAVVTQVLGLALSPTRILIDVQPPVVMG